MTTKVFEIKDNDFFQFIKKINEFNSSHSVKATQTHIDKESNYIGIIYFEGEDSTTNMDKDSNRAKQSPPQSPSISIIKGYLEGQQQI